MVDYIYFKNNIKIPIKELFFNTPVEKLDKDGVFYQTKMDNYKRAKDSYVEKNSVLKNYPIKITLQNTERCNLKCKMCQIPRDYYSNDILQDMDERLIYKLADEVFPYLVELHPSNIGESTFSKNFFVLVDLMKKYEVLLDLTTNGTLLTEKLLRHILPIVSDIKISIDGFRKETYEKIKIGAKYNSVIKNIKTAIKLINENNYSNNPTLTFQMTLFKSNYKELPDIVKLANQLGVHRVKAYYLFSFYKDLDDEVLIGSDEEKNFTSMYDETIDLAKYYNIEVEIAEPCGIDLVYPLLPVPCVLPWTQSWVDVDGHVYPCHSHNGYSLGNINETDFFNIWNSSKYQELRSSFKDNSLILQCSNCGSNYYKINCNQKVPYDSQNFKSYGPYLDVPIRWSGRMKQFDLPRYWEVDSNEF